MKQWIETFASKTRNNGRIKSIHYDAMPYGEEIQLCTLFKNFTFSHEHTIRKTLMSKQNVLCSHVCSIVKRFSALFFVLFLVVQWERWQPATDYLHTSTKWFNAGAHTENHVQKSGRRMARDECEGDTHDSKSTQQQTINVLWIALNQFDCITLPASNWMRTM